MLVNLVLPDGGSLKLFDELLSESFSWYDNLTNKAPPCKRKHFCDFGVERKVPFAGKTPAWVSEPASPLPEGKLDVAATHSSGAVSDGRLACLP